MSEKNPKNETKLSPEENAELAKLLRESVNSEMAKEEAERVTQSEIGDKKNDEQKDPILKDTKDGLIAPTKEKRWLNILEAELKSGVLEKLSPTMLALLQKGGVEVDENTTIEETVLKLKEIVNKKQSDNPIEHSPVVDGDENEPNFVGSARQFGIKNQKELRKLQKSVDKVLMNTQEVNGERDDETAEVGEKNNKKKDNLGKTTKQKNEPSSIKNEKHGPDPVGLLKLKKNSLSEDLKRLISEEDELEKKKKNKTITKEEKSRLKELQKEIEEKEKKFEDVEMVLGIRPSQPGGKTESEIKSSEAINVLKALDAERLSALGDAEKIGEKDWVQKLGEKYNKIPFWKKIAIGVGIVGISGTLGALASAGAMPSGIATITGYMLIGANRTAGGAGIYARLMERFGNKKDSKKIWNENPKLASALLSTAYMAGGYFVFKELAEYVSDLWSADSVVEKISSDTKSLLEKLGLDKSVISKEDMNFVSEADNTANYTGGSEGEQDLVTIVDNDPKDNLLKTDATNDASYAKENSFATTDLGESEKYFEISAKVPDRGGAIDAFVALKAQLRENFPNEATRPEAVKNILKYDAVSLAEKYGFFKPGSVEESALLMKGDSLSLNSNGDLYYIGASGEKTILEWGGLRGDGLSEQVGNYRGKMFDYHASEQSDISATSPEKTQLANEAITQNQEKPPVQTIQKEDVYEKETVLENPIKNNSVDGGDRPISNTHGEEFRQNQVDHAGNMINDSEQVATTQSPEQQAYLEKLIDKQAETEMNKIIDDMYGTKSLLGFFRGTDGMNSEMWNGIRYYNAKNVFEYPKWEDGTNQWTIATSQMHKKLLDLSSLLGGEAPTKNETVEEFLLRLLKIKAINSLPK